MSVSGHASPESAALTGFSAAHCRVVASETSRDDAYVLLDTGQPGRTYLYGSTCHRKNGLWFEGSSGNGPGWSATTADDEVGTLSLWGDAPAGVEMVRVEFDGETADIPVRNGVYFVVRWRVPSSSQWPEIVAVRESGEWKAESIAGLFRRWRAEIIGGSPERK